MLSNRFVNDGIPTLKLNEIQLSTKAAVDKKVQGGTYLFEKVPCAICGGHDFETLSEKDRYGLYMPVVVCKDCGLVQTNPRMTQKSYDEFYNVEYRKLYGGQEKPTKEFLNKQLGQGRRIYKYVYPFLSKIKPPQDWYVIEVGCGAGGILKYFHDQGCKVTGFDLGEEYVNYGLSEFEIDLRTGSLQDFTTDQKPDLIIYSHVLEHILDPGKELRLIDSILADAGLLYVELPGVYNLSGSYRLDFLRMLQNAHVYHFTLHTLKKLLEKYGFSLLSGDEFIASVFIKNKSGHSITASDTEYPKIVGHLKRMELARHFGLLTPSSLLIMSRKLATNLVQKIGLYTAIKRLLGR